MFKNETSIINQHYKDFDIKFIGEGWHNKIFLINNNRIFRFTKTEHGKSRMLLYNEIQPLIDDTDIKIPKFKFIEGIENSEYKAYAVYDYLYGKQSNFEKSELSNESVTKLSKFLSGIHHINLDTCILIKDKDIKDELILKYNHIQNHVFPLLDIKEQKIISDLYEYYLNSGIPETIKKTLVHGDFSQNNVIENNNEITAVIDWDGIHKNDPVYDFTYFPYDTFCQILKYYPDPKILGDNIHIRYLFYILFKPTHHIYYCTTMPEYSKYLIEKVNKLKKIFPIYKLLYNKIK